MNRANSPACALRLLGAVVAAINFSVTAPAQAVYVPNFTTSNVSGYLIDPVSGALSPIAGSPFLTGQSPVQAVVHPGGKFLYVLDAGSGDITLFSIAAPSGALTVQPCLHCEATSPSGMAIDPAGQWLFVVSSNLGTVTPYSIMPATGQLTKGAAAGTGSGSKPVQAAVDPSGRYLYVANSGTGQVSGFSINGGSLTPLPGSPYPAGSGPSSVAASSTAVYVSNLYSADISVYRMAPGGLLVPSASSVPAGGGVVSVAVDPTGNYVYAANQNQLLAFNTTPNGIFPLTYVQAQNAGTTPSFVATAPDGNFVYVVNTISNDIYGYSISAGGTLIPAGSSSAFGTNGPRFPTVQHIGETTRIELSPGYPAPSQAAYGAPVEFKGLVKNTRNPATIPRGSVSITLNGSPVPNGVQVLDASGGFDYSFNSTTQLLPVGIAIVRIAYNPGAQFEATAPAAIGYPVTRATPAFTITTSPSPAAAGQPITIAVSAPQAGTQYPSGTVTVSVDGIPMGSAAALSNGRAQISYVPIAGDHTVTTSYSGDTYFLPANSGPTSFHASQPTVTTVTTTSTSLVYGQAAVLTVSVSAAGNTPTGSVEFFDNGAKISISPSTLQAGKAQFGPYILNAVGSHSLTAIYSGDQDSFASNNNAAPLILSVAQASVTMGQPVAAGGLVYGQPVTISVAVAATAPGSGNPSGTLTFKDGSAIFGTAPISGGVAAFTTANLAAGNHAVNAVFAGDTNFQGATSSALTFTVNRATPTITASSTPQAPIVSGQDVALIATLTGNGTLTGNVEFVAGGVSLGSPVLTGKTATLSYKPPSPGTYNISVSYGGDSNNFAASATMSLPVNQSAVVVSRPSITGSPTVGQPVTVTASVAAAPPGGGLPTGIVDLAEGGTTVGSASLASGSASFTLTFLSPGARSLTATYRGDANFTGGTSAPGSITVGKAVPVLSAAADSTVLALGSSVTLTATLSGNSGPAWSGTVDWFDGAVKINAAPVLVVGDQARFGPYIMTRAGSHPFTAVYSGDAVYTTATSSNGLAVAVNQAPVSVSSPAISGTVTYGTSGTFTVTVTSPITVAGVPTGSVALKEGSVTLANAQLTNGAAILTVSSGLTAGAHSFTAAYNGDLNFMAAISSAVAVSIPKATPSVSLNLLSAGSGVVGQPVTLRAILSGGPSPTGSVDIFDSGVRITPTSVPVVNGTALISLTMTSAGAHSLTADYSGDTNFNGVTSSANPLVVTVSKSQTSASILLNSGLPTYGHTVTLLASVLPIAPGQGVPTGLVRLNGANGTSVTSGLSGGQASIVFTLSLAGKQTLAVTYDGDSNYAPVTSSPLTMIVDREQTSTILSVVQSSSATTLTARVTGTVPFMPSGTVRFMNGANTVATASLDAGSVATANLTAGVAGMITAVYSGDENFYGSTSLGSNLAAAPRAATTLSLKTDAAAVAGQSVACVVTLSAAGASAASGSIQLFDGPVLIGSMPAGVQATFSVVLTAGKHNLTASYSGDAAYAPSSAFSTLTVSRITSTVALTSGASEILVGDPFTLVANLAGPSGSSGPEPGGRIDFLDGSTVLGSAPLTNRKAAFTVSALSPGIHQLSSAYSGDANWDGTASNIFALTISKVPTQVEIHALTSLPGDSQVTVAVAVTVPSGRGTPSGTIRFRDVAKDTTLATVELSDATATASIPAAVWSSAIIAVYDGSAIFQSSSSAPDSQFSLVNAASYTKGPLAPGSIVTVFSPSLAAGTLNAELPLPNSLGGVTVTLVDFQGVSRNAVLFYVTPQQLSFLVPSEMPAGAASLRIATANGPAITALVNIGQASPGLFTANANGQGVAAAQAVHVRAGQAAGAPESVATYDEASHTWIPQAIDIGPSDVETYLILYGTGIRNRASDVIVEVDGQPIPVLFAGAHPSYAGLDQVNVRIPSTLQKNGSVSVTISIAGQLSNPVQLLFRESTDTAQGLLKF